MRLEIDIRIHTERQGNETERDEDEVRQAAREFFDTHLGTLRSHLEAMGKDITFESLESTEDG